MNLETFPAIMNAGDKVIAGSDAHLFMTEMANEAMVRWLLGMCQP